MMGHIIDPNPAKTVPRGFRLAGVHCGIKSDPEKEDLGLILLDRPAVAAGVYTQNKFAAAPVVLDRSRTPSNSIRAVVINSGNANACTGDRGIADAERMCLEVASACNIDPGEVLVLSTGVIGQFLPIDAIAAGITRTAANLADDASAIASAARAMLTTDTKTKTVERRWRGGTLLGMAKGAAMIGPKMATMLGVVLTDAAIDSEMAQRLLRQAVDESFHCVHVDGHTSTNDSVLFLASGAANVAVETPEDVEQFGQILTESCTSLARSIPDDGEGANHLITIHVRGCESRSAARKIAHTVADSPLVKTAIAGNDPNWGRIVSAAGYADVPFDPEKLELRLNGQLLFCGATPTDFSEREVSDSMRSNRETLIELHFGEGPAEARFWTSDLTEEYVRLNADYRT